jgi:hypothetical protein
MGHYNYLDILYNQIQWLIGGVSTLKRPLDEAYAAEFN